MPIVGRAVSDATCWRRVIKDWGCGRNIVQVRASLFVCVPRAVLGVLAAALHPALTPGLVLGLVRSSQLRMHHLSSLCVKCAVSYWDTAQLVEELRVACPQLVVGVRTHV